ncbi:MAG: cation diffusion facilitator family transporter [Deltaproteobacteria bacterium]|nr:cation diffusion facilitator family transporter [Deltaproteobacteria bacterium]
MAEGASHIVRALVANFLIACAKGVGAFLTGSGAMLAETLHSLSDCVNQGLLLLGLKQAKKLPDERHPLGYGRTLYFWSFMVAMLLFLGGGAYSIYEGIHKLQSPEPISSPYIAVIILSFGFAIEFWAMLGVIKVANQRRGKTPFMQYLKQTKDSDVVVIFGEDFAAVVGLGLALIAVILAWVTGNPRFDSIGTLAIGTVLIGVAIFLAVEVKSLLLGESADPALFEAIKETAAEDPRIVKVLRALTVQQGPGEVMLACKLQFKDDLTTQALVGSINEFEQRLQKRVPDIRWCFVEPDNAD